MSGRNMSDGQIYSFLELFFNTEKVRLKRRLDFNRLRVVYIHCDTTLINNDPIKIHIHPS